MKGLINNLRIFFSNAWLAYVGISGWNRPEQYISWKVITPITTILFFSLLGTSAKGGESAHFYLIGNAIQVIAINGIYGVTHTISRERSTGTLIYLLSTPANRLTIFMGRSFFHMVDGVLTVVLSLLWSVLVLGLDLSAANIYGLSLVIITTAISTCGLGLLLGSIALMTVNVLFINNTFFFMLLLFSGANIPLKDLPNWMQYVSSILPLSRGIVAARLLAQGAKLADVGYLLAGELIVGVVYIVLGFTLYRWFEVQAKRQGTLEAM